MTTTIENELFEALSGLMWATGINNLTDAQMMREYGGVGLIARRKAQAARDRAALAMSCTHGPTEAAILEEEAREEAAANGQFGVGA